MESHSDPTLTPDASSADSTSAARAALRRRRRRLGRLVLYPLLLVIVKLIGCNNLFYHPNSRVYRELAEMPVPVEEVFFESSDGVLLHAWFLRTAHRDGAVGTVVHFHGNAQNLTSHISFVDWLVLRGFNVFSFDYRGYGKSDGKPSRAGIHADGLAALAHVKTLEGVDPERLFVLGQSLGGACSLAALGEGQTDGVRAVAVDSTFLWYRDVANGALGGSAWTYPLVWLFISNEHSPGRSLERLESIPLMVFHGDEDRIVSVDHGRQVFDAKSGEKELFVVAGGDHLETFYGPQCEENRDRLVDFFRAALVEGEAPAVGGGK